MSETESNGGGPAEVGSGEVHSEVPAKRRSFPEMAGLLVVLAVLVVFFSVTSPYFLGMNNLLNILTAIAVTGVLATPGTILMISGQVDLSVGAGTALSGIVLATLTPTIGLPAAVLACVLTGAAMGLVNGAFVTLVGLNSLIVTLGGLAAFRGAAFLLGDGQTVLMPNFGTLGTSRPLGIPTPVIVFLALALLAGVLLRYTVFGRNVYAIGANPVAARLVGIRGGRTVFLAFVASGISTAIAGMILTSQLGAAVPNAAQGMELMVITAIVLGGASLSGGRGSVSGMLLGLMIIGVLNNGLILLNVSSYWQQVANGVLLVSAVSIDRLRERFTPV